MAPASEIVTPTRRPPPVPQGIDGVPVNGLNCTKTPLLGIDASASKIGFCVASGGEVLAWVYKPGGTGLDRLARIRAEVTRLARKYGIRAAMIEGYSYGSRASQAHKTGEAGGMVRLALWDLGVTLHEMSPNGLKKFVTGTGNGPKSAITLWLYKRYGLELTDEDEADATGLAFACAVLHGGWQGATPKAQHEAIAKAIELR